MLDTMPPVTRAKKAVVRRGKLAALPFSVVDARPGSATAAVTVLVKDATGTSVLTVSLRDAQSRHPSDARFRASCRRASTGTSSTRPTRPATARATSAQPASRSADAGGAADAARRRAPWPRSPSRPAGRRRLGSLRRETTSALTARSTLASTSDTVNEPLPVRSTPMTQTKATEHCPNSWMSPLDVPSGVGA